MDIKALETEVYGWCERKGWNENLCLGEMIANVHTEVSEAWEEIRNNHLATEVYTEPANPTKPLGFPIELADTIIRILHIAAHFGIDIESAIRSKMAYNETRPRRHGGKAA
jgi:NTP pyrophosphatase (non-canonical NTP hydrolase)